MEYKKIIKLAKDYKNKETSIVASVFQELNFDKIYLEVCSTINCNLYSHIFIFNQKSALFVEKCQNIITLDWCDGVAEIALINLNQRKIVGSTVNVFDYNNFELLLKNALYDYLHNKKLGKCQQINMSNSTSLKLRSENRKGNKIFEKIYIDKLGSNLETSKKDEFIEKQEYLKKLSLSSEGIHNKSFYDLNKINKIMKLGEEEKILNAKFKNSTWRKLYIKNLYYVFGIIFKNNKPKYLGVGVPVITRSQIGENLKKFTTFYPAREHIGNGFGFYLGFKDIETGENVRLSIT